MEKHNNANQADPNHEYEYRGHLWNGFVALLIHCVVIPAVLVFLFAIPEDTEAFAPLIGICAVALLIGFGGYFTQEPNEARVMIFFGKYRGTCRRTGFFWANPFMSRRKISLRIRNMDIEPIKVNDKVGNPVMIGMVLVWKVNDTYRVTFDLDSTGADGNPRVKADALSRFVRIQGDAALREVTGRFAYDQTEGDRDELTLRDGGEAINELLERKINERLAMAGIEVVEARLNYLAYAPEIAAVMLRRQQASAIIMAREKLVEGAVSIVELPNTVEGRFGRT